LETTDATAVLPSLLKNLTAVGAITSGMCGGKSWETGEMALSTMLEGFDDDMEGGRSEDGEE